MTVTPQQMREAASVLESLVPTASREYGDSYFGRTAGELIKLAVKLEKAAKPKPPPQVAVSSYLREDGAGSVYVEIPGEDKVFAVYVGELAPDGRLYTQELNGHPADWGTPLNQ